MEDAKSVLDDLRWTADRVITNHSGERVWLRQIEDGITDCCPAGCPCDYHARLTHGALPSKH